MFPSSFRRFLLAFLALLLAAGQARADCPPPPQLPTPEQFAAQAPNAPDRGFLWKLTRDGRTSYLYGSLHIGKPEWLLPGPALRAAWQSTQRLALELDLTEAQTLQDITKAVAPGKSGRALAQRLQKRLDAQAAALCVPAQALKTLHPLMQISTLALFDGRRDGFDAGFGQEIALGSLAREQGREIVALEKVGTQMAALIPADAKLAGRLAEQGLAQLERGEARSSLRALAEVWERGDLERLASYEQWCDCVASEDERRWLRGMNDGRNPALARRIAALHAEGRPLLVAVGALHMTGPQALPLLLQRAGFQVERVTSR